MPISHELTFPFWCPFVVESLCHGALPVYWLKWHVSICWKTVTPVMCEHVVSWGAPTTGWRAGGGVQPFLGMWPSMCQSIQMYSLESYGTENRGSFLQQYYPFLVHVVWLNTTPCYPLPGDGSRWETSTPQWRVVVVLLFLYLHVPRGHQHHNHDDVVVVVLPLFCICTWPDLRPPRPRRIIIQSSWKKNDVEVEKVVEEARGCWVSTWSLSPFENL